MTTSEQRDDFRQALAHARRKLGWSQRRLAEAIGVSHSTVAYWERGRSLPEPNAITALERALELDAGTLSRLLGYMPVATRRRDTIGVIDAIMADPELGTGQRELLMTMYRELIRQTRENIQGERDRRS